MFTTIVFAWCIAEVCASCPKFGLAAGKLGDSQNIFDWLKSQIIVSCMAGPAGQNRVLVFGSVTIIMDILSDFMSSLDLPHGTIMELTI